MMFINALLNGVIQVVLFAMIPFVWWLITARKKESFFHWIGLKKVKTEDTGKFWKVFWIILIVGFVVGEILVYLQGDVESAQSSYTGMGISAVPAALAYALIQTSLSEELLFRGFLQKRLSAKFGFHTANIIQASIFGVLHLILLWGNVAPWYLVLAVLYPMALAMSFSYLNEKLAGGSILPSWCIHAIVNIISQLLAIF